MAEHLHVYEKTGRCIRSVPLNGDMSVLHAGAPIVVLRALLEMRFKAEGWCAEERSGTAVSNDVGYIFRIKPVALARDMMAVGARQALDDIRLKGIEIDPQEVWASLR